MNSTVPRSCGNVKRVPGEFSAVRCKPMQCFLPRRKGSHYPMLSEILSVILPGLLSFTFCRLFGRRLNLTFSFDSHFNFGCHFTMKPYRNLVLADGLQRVG